MELRIVWGLAIGLITSCQPKGQAELQAWRGVDARTLVDARWDAGGMRVLSNAATGRAVWVPDTSYDFHLTSTAMADLGGAGKTISFKLEAGPRVIVAEQRQNRTTLYLQLLEIRLTNLVDDGGAELDRLAEELAKGDCLAVFSGGRLMEIGFRAGVSNAYAASYRQLAASLQLVGAPDGGSSWQSEEYDTSGQYIAQYHLDAVSRTYLKEKVRYLGLLGRPYVSGIGPLQLVPEIRKSKGEIQLTPEGYLERVDLEDELLVEGAQVPIRASTRFVLMLSKVGSLGSVTEARHLLSGFTMTAASELGAKTVSIESLDGARTQGTAFRSILSRIEADREARLRKGKRISARDGRGTANVKSSNESSFVVGDIALFNSLVASLRESEEAVLISVQMIKEQSPLMDVLIDALGSASSPSCETALTELLSSGDSETRPRVLHALALTSRPGSKSIAAMKSVLAEEPYSQAGLYGLGAYARRLAEQGRSDKAAELGEFLLRKLEEADNATDKITSLRAIENSAYAEGVGALQRFFDDGDLFVRKAAIRALGPMKSQVVEEVVASRITAVESAEEQLLLLELAEARGPSDVLVSAVGDAVGTPNVNVRRRVVGLLGKWAPSRPGLRKFLKNVANTDSDSQVRAVARAAL